MFIFLLNTLIWMHVRTVTSRQGGSIEFPQSMYCSKTKKKVYPCKPQLFWKCLKLKTKSWLNLKFSSTCVTCNMNGGFLSRAFVFSLIG